MDARSPDTAPIGKPPNPARVEPKADSVHGIGISRAAASAETPPLDPADLTLHGNEPVDHAFEAELEATRRGLKTSFQKPAFDPDATFHEEPMNPKFTTELAAARQESGKSTKRPILQKAGDVISKAAGEARMAATMAAQLGGIHPWLIDGKWRWVVEPWARFAIDPHQHEWDRGMNSFLLDRFLELKAEGVKTISAKHLENYDGVPAIKLILPLGLQYLNQHRIQAAQAAGLRIEVDILRGYDTFN